MAEPPHPGLHAAIAALWSNAEQRARAGVETLEAAVAALRNGKLGADAADEATREAHKLAGALAALRAVVEAGPGAA